MLLKYFRRFQEPPWNRNHNYSAICNFKTYSYSILNYYEYVRRTREVTKLKQYFFVKVGVKNNTRT